MFVCVDLGQLKFASQALRMSTLQALVVLEGSIRIQITNINFCRSNAIKTSPTLNSVSPKVSSTAPMSTLATQSLRHNTSIAGAVVATGERRIYYQGTQGEIKEARRSNETNNWPAPADFVVTHAALNGTPLCAVAYNEIIEGLPKITLGYIIENNVSQESQFQQQGNQTEPAVPQWKQIGLSDPSFTTTPIAPSYSKLTLSVNFFNPTTQFSAILWQLNNGSLMFIDQSVGLTPSYSPTANTNVSDGAELQGPGWDTQIGIDFQGVPGKAFVCSDRRGVEGTWFTTCWQLGGFYEVGNLQYDRFRSCTGYSDS
jgi:hypothetical protein